MRQRVVVRKLIQIKLMDLLVHLVCHVPFLSCGSHLIEIEVYSYIRNPFDNCILFHFCFKTVICKHFSTRLRKLRNRTILFIFDYQE